jgi:hypothetical protein
MPLGILAAVSSTSGAAPSVTKVNATNATVTCTGISGSAKFSPAVTTDEKAGTAKTTIKATLTGCTTSDGVTVTKASASGVLADTRTAGENDCIALAGNSDDVGTLTTKWTTTPKLSSGSTVIKVNSVSRSIGSDGNATFSIPGSVPNGTPSGSFQGTNGEASDATSAQTTTSASSILTMCEGKSGLKSFNIESPASGAAVTLAWHGRTVTPSSGGSWQSTGGDDTMWAAPSITI